VAVKGTRGNEGAERSGVHGKEKWTKDRALGDTTGGCVPGRQVSYTFDTIGADSTGATGNFAPVLTQEPGQTLRFAPVPFMAVV